jgi:flagellin-specific chaperone FliS
MALNPKKIYKEFRKNVIDNLKSIENALEQQALPNTERIISKVLEILKK